MKVSSIKKVGATLLTTALLSTSLIPSNVKADNDKYKLDKSVQVYLNIYDAKKNNNSVGKYSKGDYYIYRELEDYVNISRNLGEPGAWISKDKNTLESVFTENKKEEKSVKTRVESKNVATINKDKVKLTSPVSIYYSSDDALNSKNSAGTYSEGTYYIYKEYNGSTNISKTKNSPGAWVVLDAKNENKVETNKTNTSKTVINKESKNDKTVEVKETKEEVKETKNDANRYELNKSFGTYVTAHDAKNGTNRRGVLSKGTYYIYKEYNGMLNLSRSRNSVGSWINPKETEISKKVQNYSNEENKSSSNSTSKSSSGTGQQIANEASKYIGYRYVYGAHSPNRGFDCSGLTYYTLRTVKGITIPRSSSAQFRSGQRVSKSNLQAGDLLFFGSSSSNISHVGVYIGNGQMVHASTPKSGVKVSNIYSNWYSSRYQGARRY